MVDTVDSKSTFERSAGSSPVTDKYIRIYYYLFDSVSSFSIY